MTMIHSDEFKRDAVRIAMVIPPESKGLRK